jgi:hypothetical protein
MHKTRAVTQTKKIRNLFYPFKMQTIAPKLQVYLHPENANIGGRPV